MPSPQRQAESSAWGQKTIIISLVLILHASVIWALHHGTQKIIQPQVISAEVIAQFIAPPTPQLSAPAPAAPQATPEPPKATPQPKPKPQPAKPKPTPREPTLPKAVATPTPAPDAPTGVLDTSPSNTVDTTPTTSTAAAVSTPATPVSSQPSGNTVELPSSNASYLNNPKPSYPSISRRLQEEGQVLLRVLVSAEGLPEKIEIKQSSGFDRLDQAAVKSVQNWKFSPGKRNGVPETMWNIVPINFVLE